MASMDNVRRQRERHHVFSNLFSGAVAGAVAKSTIAPLDRAKIVFQVSTNKAFSFRKCFRFLQNTVKQDGYRALWKGNAATMVRIVPYAGISFTTNEHFKSYLSQDGHLSNHRRFLAGSMAGITASSLTYVLEVMRARIACQPEHKTMRSSARLIWAEQGYRSLFRGLVPTLFGVFIYGGTSFTVYGILKKRHTSEKEISFYQRFAYGAIAGGISQTISYPIDIVRRRMQTGGILGDHSERYSTVRSTIKHIRETEGIRKGLYKGLSLNYVKGPVAVGISYTVFDFVNQKISGQYSS